MGQRPCAEPRSAGFRATWDVFPLRARPGGVLERRGQTEAAVDVARLAGLSPAGVIRKIMNEDGTMARVPDLVRFCKTHRLIMVSVADLARHRMKAAHTDSADPKSVHVPSERDRTAREEVVA